MIDRRIPRQSCDVTGHDISRNRKCAKKRLHMRHLAAISKLGLTTEFSQSSGVFLPVHIQEISSDDDCRKRLQAGSCYFRFPINGVKALKGIRSTNKPTHRILLTGLTLPWFTRLLLKSTETASFTSNTNIL